jgi:ATP-dependent RNA helicase RhlE
MMFTDLGLTPAILRALATLGHDTPTPIQQQAIPLVLEGHDLMAAAQTGTGKTGGFALPILTKLFPEGAPRPTGRAPRVLVLTPTRELAAQVHDSFKQYGAHTTLRTATIFGGVGMQPQVDALRRGLDVLIATPGRLLDHLGQRTADLSAVDTLVLDEADRMLDMGFLPALKRVLNYLPKQRQTLMFSATFSDDIKQLAAQFLRAPREVSVTPRNTIAETITHRVHPVDASRKRNLLIDVMAQDSRRQTLIFARTKHGANKLAEVLEGAGFRAAAIHGNKSQNARTKALSDFKSGRIAALVATDIAARGLDIPQLPVVINFDLPMVAEDYVHRIGRTGRAGANGLAISLVGREDQNYLRGIERLLKAPLKREPLGEFKLPERVAAEVEKVRQPQGQRRPQQRAGAAPASRGHNLRSQGQRVPARGNGGQQRSGGGRPAAR